MAGPTDQVGIRSGESFKARCYFRPYTLWPGSWSAGPIPYQYCD